jgi:hypothetical protein
MLIANDYFSRHCPEFPFRLEAIRQLKGRPLSSSKRSTTREGRLLVSNITVNGSSVGSFFWLACAACATCSGHVVATNTLPRHQSSLAGQLVTNLDFFAPICDKMH